MTAQDIKEGDLVLPPEREIRLWMRRALGEKKLAESALLLTVAEVSEGKPDKKGRWTVVKGRYSREWCGDYANPLGDYFLTFKARPETPWTILRNGGAK